jgi:hypothetical protein
MVTLQFCEHCHSLFKAPPSNIQRPRFSICQFAHTTPLPGLEIVTAWLHEKDVGPDWIRDVLGRSSEVLELKREVWCEGGDLNPYALSSTSPSN